MKEIRVVISCSYSTSVQNYYHQATNAELKKAFSLTTPAGTLLGSLKETAVSARRKQFSELKVIRQQIFYILYLLDL
jgi:hypothetical protein